ncbi:CarD family transcriptional regulator [Kineothrix sp. MSJ-39]|uniref:CarD family transcriptional regulator n=1 Tax=Kineothrix sp. MSJ-39 TaxID=2841533 RepID=UPI001C116C95|nr:CarD family transcriptional regulator [Kineothrix sp. MSJ-39]MBU5430371.1 CarD family transcriptional regulator [Kineothrix sp. MSJ-39]
MFEKKTYIYDEEMGVCFIEDIARLATKNKQELGYYVLRSVYRKDKVAYIPVENHEVQLRELITKEEAEKRREEWNMDLGEQEEEVSEPGDFAWQLDYTMADTLPLDKRKELYLKGEVEFVLAGIGTGK